MAVMRTAEVENKVLKIVEAVEGGNYSEDDLVELKADWPEPAKAAKRIAGHANAARGEPILWIVGLDEHKGVGVLKHVDFAKWWPAVERRFDGRAPVARVLSISTPKGTVVAIVFETEAAPFVVTVEGGGADREVPYRSGTAVRSAKRDELLRILVPTIRLPDVVPTQAELNRGDGGRWALSALLLFLPRAPGMTTVLSHRSTVRVKAKDAEPVQEAVTLAPTNAGANVDARRYPAFEVTRAEQAFAVAHFDTFEPPQTEDDLGVVFELGVMNADRPIIVVATLRPAELTTKGVTRWALRQSTEAED